MERELVAVGMNLKTLEVHEERALQRENSFSDHIQSLQNRIKEVKIVGNIRISEINKGKYIFPNFCKECNCLEIGKVTFRK
ncbi:unnamed protein product [Onchocerca flexuosa]|uniref:Conjugal transfer protein n=1 Tax=Onchocerca flexuosa TaxID=387005 RepID=A0A183HQX4_9BILA|nr:unnamed protein product [Onchocerca flexuosa]